MQTFKKIIDFIKKALGEAHYKNGSYRFGDKQYDPIFENSESYFYMEQLIKKYKPAE